MKIVIQYRLKAQQVMFWKFSYEFGHKNNLVSYVQVTSWCCSKPRWLQ